MGNLLPMEAVLSTECVLIHIIVTISTAVGNESNFRHGEFGTKSLHRKTYMCWYLIHLLSFTKKYNLLSLFIFLRAEGHFQLVGSICTLTQEVTPA